MSHSTAHSPDSSPPLPVAVVQPRQPVSWVWIVPLVALIAAAWLGWSAWSGRGMLITVQLEDGHGLKQGDEVRFRGISVGQIDAVSLSGDAQGVIVTARLKPSSEHLARSGSSFWVVRPQFQITGIGGLETLVGPRYLAVSPDSSQRSATDAQHSAVRQRHFIGLAQPPIIDLTLPGDLEIILQSTQRGSLRPGAPVTYRQTRIGTILSVGLNGDASAVEARVHIQQPFITLIRPNTRFWDVGGIEAKLGLGGLSVNVDSAEALLAGGVALATPPIEQSGGDIVRTGHRFRVSAKSEDEWMEWQPMVAIGNSLLPPGIAPPSPLRATIGWTQGRLFKNQRSVHGWVLQTSEGLLGPADLLKPGDKANPDTVALEVAGSVVPLVQQPVWERNGLALLNVHVITSAWPAAQQRTPSGGPEECLIITDPSETAIPLAASRLSVMDAGAGNSGDGQTSGGWRIDPAVPINESMHGACVVSRRDGKLLGMLLVNNGKPVVALLHGEEPVNK